MFDVPYELDPAQVHQFRENGHVLLRGVFPEAELGQYREKIAEKVKEGFSTLSPIHQRNTYAKAFLQLTNLWKRDLLMKEFVFSKRFSQIAAKLMGSNGVRLYHDQALFKEPDGGITPWHQDQSYWPISSSNSNRIDAVTMWMPLVDVSHEMGALMFADKTHAEGRCGVEGISDGSQEKFEQLIHEKRFQCTQIKSMKAGDATFHAGWTIHGAPRNRSQQMREAMTIIYIDSSSTVCNPGENQQADFERWFPGLKPGDLAASPLNPVLFSKL